MRVPKWKEFQGSNSSDFEKVQMVLSIKEFQNLNSSDFESFKIQIVVKLKEFLSSKVLILKEFQGSNLQVLILKEFKWFWL